ncbi:MAG: hypothetical protein CVV23_03490 [Ignavibacteriae bacterium HGW-Ignavibacteriae-2]|jgi:hypothetical protein|nr:hypothetical protein [Bacteroidota bacterium]PKL89768.1 MAG: hypothetical protein CVV23_03490 [Ignavibacteriae bacterium HGW-Ignavibacteriae-2]
MATLPAPGVNKAPENSIEKQVHNIVEKLNINIPLPNDRIRLGYGLYQYMLGQGDPPEILIKSTKIEIVGIAKGELAALLNEELGKITN